MAQGYTAGQLATGTLAVTAGGTGRATLTSRGVLIGAGTSAINQTTAGTSGQLLISQGAGADPTWTTTTYPTTNAVNTLLYASSANGMAALANGTTGQILTATTGSAPSWAAPAAGVGVNRVIVQVFTSNGTYTPTSGMLYCTAEVVGGGGGSGGCAATAGAQASAGIGGGGGGYARKTFTAATIGVSKAVTVGTGGTAGAAGNNAGGAGVTSSLGVLITATGGTAGPGGAVVGGSATASGVAGGVGTSGDFNCNGSPSSGTNLFPNGNNIYGGSSGGSSYFGGGGLQLGATGAANAGLNYGGGAGGPVNQASLAAKAGAAGADGIVVITEYCS